MPPASRIPILALLLLLAGACRRGPVEDPSLAALPLGDPAPVCISDGEGIACGGEACQRGEDGVFRCPNRRQCTLETGGAAGPTILCQQGPGDPPVVREGTTERPPVLAPPNEEIRSGDSTCSAAVIAKIRILRPGSDTAKETANLAHGFSEVVVPFGFNARILFRPGPDGTGPYRGTLTGTWFVEGNAIFVGRSGSRRSNLARGWTSRRGGEELNPGPNRPVMQQHSIAARWVARSGVQCDMDQFDFLLTFGGQLAPPPPLDLADFVRRVRADSLGTSTRVYRGAPRFRNDNVVLPLLTYWVADPDCCGVVNPKRKVIQFARAAIHGPNGRLANPWLLDILDSEAERAPQHDPSYTSRPNGDGNDTVTPDGGGGTATVGTNVFQWDAPGMPKDLYDRLYWAQGASTYRQQFLAVLVCSRNDGADRHRTAGYLATGRVRQVAVTTVQWDFLGQRAPNPAPVIRVTSASRDGGCAPLRGFLEANGVLGEFERPSRDARSLRILSRTAYEEVRREVERWEADPLGQIRFP